MSELLKLCFDSKRTNMSTRRRDNEILDQLNVKVRVDHTRTQAGGVLDQLNIQVRPVNHNNAGLHLSVEVEDLDFPVQVEDSGWSGTKRETDDFDNMYIKACKEETF